MITNRLDFVCSCGAKFRSMATYNAHMSAFPRKCREIKAPLTPKQYAETPTEHAQQVALFMWAALPETLKKYPVLEYMFAIPNGGLRMPAIANRLKAEGVKRGVPDIFLPMPKPVNSGYPQSFIAWRYGLFIEMKRPTTIEKAAGVTSDEQDKFISFLRGMGYACVVCYTFQDARQVIIDYLDENLHLAQGL